ncbi:hypothetical protein BH11MYX1_BH11MYX1_13760 [soil metagenome]
MLGSRAVAKPKKPVKLAKKPAAPKKSNKRAKKSPTPKSTRVTTPAPPVVLPPAPPPQRDELAAPRDIGRLIRYGERFGPNKIDVRMWNAPNTTVPAQLPLSSGSLAILDPADKKSWRLFDRPAGTGQFRIMLSTMKPHGVMDQSKDRLAAIVIHTGRPPIARWTVAHWSGQKKPRSAAELPSLTSTQGWLALVDGAGGWPGLLALPASAGTQPVEVALTDGRRALAIPTGRSEVTAYWAVDAADKPICLVLDCDAITQKDWKAKP